MSIRRIAVAITILALMLTLAATTLAQNQTHTVQPGETLFSIARKYGLTVDELAFANGITNPDLIYAGQVLTIPGASGGATATATATAGQSGQPTTYTVKAGDTLFSIARRFGTTVAALTELNGLSDPDSLSVGQVLKLPSTGGGTGTSTPTSDTGEIVHVVQAGETLSRIAVRYGTTYQQIALLNDLDNPDLIYVGQRLIIRPAADGDQTATVTAATTQTETVTPSPATTTSEPATQATTVTATTPATETITALPPATEETPIATEEPTEAPTTATEEPTAEPDDDFPTPTPIIPEDSTIPDNAPNRLTNPGFEGSVRPVGLSEINVFQGWEPFYCDEPYTPEKCPALRQGDGNPEGLMMGRPEYKATDIDNRVHGGSTAQQWFCFFRACQAGVYQTVETTPGAACEAGAYVQSWSGDGSGFTSDLLTEDDRANSTWFIKVSLDGNTFAFSDQNLVSEEFGYEHGIYDKYVKIRFRFTANSTRTTVFFENLRLFPIANNDNYIDDAYVRCSQ